MPLDAVALASFASLPNPGKRYSKFQCIGRGASKVVYKGFDEVEGIEVAWNEVACSDWVLGSAKERQHVMGEIQMLRQLKHRNVMRLYDWWYDRSGQVLVFITELLTDGSLRRFIRRKHAAGITLSALKRYAWQILQGLVYLHGHYPPIIHRDLKCDNVFVNGAAGELKIGDLGFATLLKGMSAPLSVIGTPEFMAPELYDERYDEKVDIYSFGMCLLEMATQEYPYAECTNPAQIFRKVTTGVPPAAVQKVAFPALKDFILLTIQPDPAKRPEARQLLVHPFFEDVRQQIRSKGCLRMPPAAANAAAAAAVALAAAGMPAGEALALDAAVVVGAGAAAGCLPLSPTPQSVPTGLEQLVKDEAAAEAAARLPSDTAAAADAARHMQQNALTWGPAQSNQAAAAAAVMAAMAAAGHGPQQQQPNQQQPLQERQQYLQSSASGGSNYSSALSTPMHSIVSMEASVTSLASNSSWASSVQQQQPAAGRGRRRPPDGRRSSFEGRRSTDEMSEEDVLFDASQEPETGDGEGDSEDADGCEDRAAGGSSRKHHRQQQRQGGGPEHQQQQQQQQHEHSAFEGQDGAGGEEYLSPIHEDEDEDEEEGVDCECRRIDQEQLSFNVGFFNAKGMKKRVGFQFNALEDTVESIGLEMVEQLALNPHQVRAIADKIRAALEALGISNTAGIDAATAAAAAAAAGGSPAEVLLPPQEQAIGQTAAFAIVATAAATAAIEEALDASSSPGGLGPGSMGGPVSPFGAAAAAAGAGGEAWGFTGPGEAAAAAAGGPGSRGSSLNGPLLGAAGSGALASCSRSSSLGVPPHSPGLPSCSGGQLVGGTSPTSTSLGLLGVSPGSAAAAVAAGAGGSGGVDAAAAAGGVRMCPQQLVRQLSMLGRGAATALLANLQEDLLQQSYASPEAAAAIGLDATENGSVHGGVALAKPPLPPIPSGDQQQQGGHQQQQQEEGEQPPLPDAVKTGEGGDKRG